VDDSCVDTCSSKLGGEGTADDVCVIETCDVGAEFFLPAGSTAANASMPLATLVGRVGIETVAVVDVESGVDLGFGDEDFDCAGVKTSYFVDHFKVFSYPGQGKFRFLHCKQLGAVSSHLSFTTVSACTDMSVEISDSTLLSLHRLHPFLDLVFFALRSLAKTLS
jgi:hypothetical protein